MRNESFPSFLVSLNRNDVTADQMSLILWFFVFKIFIFDFIYYIHAFLDIFKSNDTM